MGPLLTVPYILKWQYNIICWMYPCSGTVFRSHSLYMTETFKRSYLMYPHTFRKSFKIVVWKTLSPVLTVLRLFETFGPIWLFRYPSIQEYMNNAIRHVSPENTLDAASEYHYSKNRIPNASPKDISTQILHAGANEFKV